MHFRIADDVRSFFGNIVNSRGSHGSEDPNKFMVFDPYYLCALIGMAACKIDEDESGMGDIVQGYPGPYRESKAYIAGLLVASEAKRQNIDLNNPKLEMIMLEYLSSENDTLLTDKGIKILNAYSRKGARLYREVFPDKPLTREDFLSRFNVVMQLYCA